MNLSGKFVLRGTAWTVGTYGISTALRFGSNVVLSRLVVPEVFGIMLVINTLRAGIDLLSDVGIGQNIVHSPNGDDRRFRNTAWTVQVLRGALLFAVFVLAAPFLGSVYGLPSEAIQLSAFSLLILGFCSVSVHLLQRRLRIVTSNLFDLAMDVVGIALTIGLAYWWPSFWSLIIAGLVASTIRAAATYLLPEAPVRLDWKAEDARQILSFGKWIYLASMLAFLCASIDKLYLGSIVPLAVLGIYGIARNIADLPVALAGRIGYSIVFPLIAAERDLPREIMRGHLAPIRLKLLLACALCIGLAAGFADYAVRLVYDSRYHDAAWMLPILLLGAWGSVMCSVNEYLLLGLGKPLYGAAANVAKLAYLGLGMAVAWSVLGLVGAVAVIALADVSRYLIIAFGQGRERVVFLRQDMIATVLLVAVIAAISLARIEAGFGTTFDGLPL
ncbi:oligosaccharide flippase family protein [Antarcticirhabdus aurantiaca]|uniref:Oligosaccharide flippase family protein n=1 Tax=Antarcticirhabdus aurantiaca TaxID=2606717 RepID=A0ACD4NWL8_9HYPH|nr:oligosaccharide flippase family protein [Antarcticirhabdus aurantiaca]WAJ31108.1 oligosaccharide flippase family protein [Jeongeuplla avenae]